MAATQSLSGIEQFGRSYLDLAKRGVQQLFRPRGRDPLNQQIHPEMAYDLDPDRAEKAGRKVPPAPMMASSLAISRVAPSLDRVRLRKQSCVFDLREHPMICLAKAARISATVRN
jgi:hypothetical protein